MKRIIGILLVLALVLSLSLVATTPVAAATTYYVATTGDNANSGLSWANAWATIHHAVDAADPGDTILVGAGTYEGLVIVYKEGLTIQSLSGAATTIIDASTYGIHVPPDSYLADGFLQPGYSFDPYTWSLANDPGLLSNGFLVFADSVVIDGFTIINAGPTSIGLNRGQGVLLGTIGSTYRSFYPPNIDQWGGTWGGPNIDVVVNDAVIRNNIIKDCADGIYSYYGSRNLIQGNVISDITRTVERTHAIHIRAGADNVAKENTISNVSGSAARGVGFMLWGHTANALVINNSVDTADKGFWLLHSHSTTITCNSISNCGYGVDAHSTVSGSVIIWHNVITDSTMRGVENGSTPVLDARDNWWGDDSGPSGGVNDPITGKLANGTGDAVSSNVRFDPWIKKMVTAPSGQVSFSPSAGNIVGLTPVAPPSLPSVSFPHGMFSFQICCLTPGQTVDVTITLPSAVPVGTVWWKYDNGRWYSLPNLNDNGNNVMVIRLTDGGAGDSDGLKDGVITDPGGPGNPMTVGWETSPTNKAALLVPWTILLAAIAAGAVPLVWRRRRAQI